MKRNMFGLTLAASLLTLAFATPALAADKDSGKEITVKGEAKCAKCALHETAKCQNVIQTEKDGKKTTYYLVQNDVSKKFHSNVCKESKKVKVTGICKKVDDKLELTAKKLELAK